jgi:hypothetical protein
MIIPLFNYSWKRFDVSHMFGSRCTAFAQDGLKIHKVLELAVSIIFVMVIYQGKRAEAAELAAKVDAAARSRQLFLAQLRRCCHIHYLALHRWMLVPVCYGWRRLPQHYWCEELWPTIIAAGGKCRRQKYSPLLRYKGKEILPWCPSAVTSSTMGVLVWQRLLHRTSDPVFVCSCMADGSRWLPSP